MKDDPHSRKFFLTTNEFEVFKDNEKKYLLYRIYNVENNPIREIVDPQRHQKKA